MIHNVSAGKQRNNWILFFEKDQSSNNFAKNIKSFFL